MQNAEVKSGFRCLDFKRESAFTKRGMNSVTVMRSKPSGANADVVRIAKRR